MDAATSLPPVLCEFARTAATNVPIETVLDHLAHTAVEVLEVGGAGVTMLPSGAGRPFIAASDDAAMQLQLLQAELGEGPCVGAFETGEAVLVPSLREDDRFPGFATRALDLGLEAVFTFPLGRGAERLGALDTYRSAVGPMDATAVRAGQALADVATAFLLNARDRARRDDAPGGADEDLPHDALTGLPKLTVLIDRLDHAIVRTRADELVAVMSIDLDQFGVVNGAYGHHVGDQLLITLADRLAGRIRGADTVARLYGDEFVLLCTGLAGPSDIDDIAVEIESAVSEPFVLADAQVKITASVGIAIGDRDHGSAHLLEASDTALRCAKRRGGARCVTTNDRGLDLRDRRRAAELAGA